MNSSSRTGFSASKTGAFVVAMAISLAIISVAGAVPWMFQPTGEPHSLSNNYCELQDYGYNYYHDGIDVIKPTGGVPVYSVSDGVMTHETPGTMYGGLMIGDEYAAGAEGWLYWHMPNSTYPFNVGDRIIEGDYIGDIAYWSVYDFHHVHFNRVVGTGGLPWSWYESIDNPLDLLEPTTDPQSPTIYNAVGTDLLAFCINNSSSYRDPDNLRGDVDIITKIGDLCWNNQWEIAPYRIEYTISGAAVYEHHLAFVFDDVLPPSNTILTVYKDDATCNSSGNYDYRDFFFVLTNNDGDEIIEASDSEGKWHTAGYPAGTYTITVDAYDAGGNLTQDSMQVTVAEVPAYDVSITLTPTSSLQLPASGGSFSFTVDIQNNETNSVNFDGWITITYPDSSTVNPIQRSLSLPPGGSIFRELTQTIAGSEPNGTYDYDGKVGYSPYNSWEVSGFSFTKGIDADGAGRWAERTVLNGWKEIPESQSAALEARPETIELLTVFPNPFNPMTEISFNLQVAGFVKLEVYDINGRHVGARLPRPYTGKYYPPGVHQITFDGSGLPSGIYIYRLTAGDLTASGKMILMK